MQNLARAYHFLENTVFEHVLINTIEKFTSTISRRTRLQTDMISCSIIKGESVKTLMGNASVLSHHAMVHWNLAFGQSCISSTLNFDLILWHTQLIVCAVKY